MFKQRLLDLRKTKGFSQKKLAEMLFISQQAYAKYEIGTATPSLYTLARLSSIFNVSADYLLGLTDKQKVMSNFNSETKEVVKLANIGDRIKLLRTSSELSQEEFGRIFGIVKSTVCLYESGRSCPNDEVKINICRHFNVSLDYLMGLSDEQQTNKAVEIDDTEQLLIDEYMDMYKKLNNATHPEDIIAINQQIKMLLNEFTLMKTKKKSIYDTSL